MKQHSFTQDKIFIFPCAGNSNVGRLTLLAAQELILEDKGKWVYSTRITELQRLGNKSNGGPPFIVVDGCKEQCGRKYLEKLAYEPEFILSLADLGIENMKNTEFGDEDLQLVKDAIIAECTRLSERSPVIFSGCGCR